ncbi:MAG: 16S rRNA processing protein RimM [Ignavibacteriaceae bacterium]|nr:ribosome maturation factor RimM [Ignavibacteriaceae bacterium]NUM70000.1 16S rRNA processing protein RimM [Ignavibacteriaceae bacterium]
MTDYYLIGKITGQFGKHGFLKIECYSDFPERFRNLKESYILVSGNYKKVFVDKVRRENDSLIIRLKGFESPEDSKFLINKELFVDQDNLVKLPADYYFVHDLIGSAVHRNGVQIGVITDVLNLPANDVYVIKAEAGEELMIPAVKMFIEKFDSESKILYLTPGDQFYTDENDED